MSDFHTVYRCFDAQGHLLYVGVTKSIPNRFAHHSANSHWWPQVARVSEEHYATRNGGLTAEARAIRTEVPRHNVQLTSTGTDDALGQYIARRMDEMGMSRHDLAQRVGHSLRVLDRVFRSGSRMKLSTLESLAEALEFDPAEAIATWEASR